MLMNVQLTGLNLLKDRIKKAPDVANDAALLAMKVFTLKSKNDIQKLLNVRGEPDGTPRKVTGWLLQNVYGTAEQIKKFVVEGKVGDSAEYAAYLEFGTSKMKPRPFIRPTVENNLKYFEQLMIAVLKQL